MALDAIIFDVDGTLVDSNPLHIEAFRLAFAGCGYKVQSDRIAVEMGKGGDQLVPAILGAVADRKDGDAIRADQPVQFEALAKKQGINLFPEVERLIAEVRRRGLMTVIATSGGKKQLAVLQKYSGFDFKSAADVLVTFDDVQNSKPAPDLLASAVKNSKLSAAQCVLLGDSVYDAASAHRAGVVSLGVLCGGSTAESLLGAGMRRVFRDPAEVLNRFDEALQTASPGPSHLTREIMERLMQSALTAAEEGMADNEVPIGAVIALGDGTVVARGWNQLNRTHNPIDHAEIVAFNAAGGKLPQGARDLILVSTLEPCVMCTGAAMEAAIDTILFGLRAPADAGSGRVSPPRSPDIQMPRIIGDILAADSLELLKKWFARNEAGPQARYVRQLLQLHGAV